MSEFKGMDRLVYEESVLSLVTINPTLKLFLLHKCVEHQTAFPCQKIPDGSESGAAQVHRTVSLWLDKSMS